MLALAPAGDPRRDPAHGGVFAPCPASLQVPFLLNLGNELTVWQPSFRSSSPVAAPFSLLHKLDHCFASLLLGRDLTSGEILPGLEDGPRRAGMTRTDMVRCKNIAEQTRVVAVKLMGAGYLDSVEGGGEDAEDDCSSDDFPDGGSSDDDHSKNDYTDDDDDDDDEHMDVARVYFNTLRELDELLPSAGLGEMLV